MTGRVSLLDFQSGDKNKHFFGHLSVPVSQQTPSRPPARL